MNHIVIHKIPAQLLPAHIAGSFANLLPWINSELGSLNGLQFVAQELDHSLHESVTIAIDVVAAGSRVGTYKLNILPDLDANYLVLCPLVIMWADNGKHRKAGMDTIIIEHCLKWVDRLTKTLPMSVKDVIVATGYLTVQRGGMPFFANLGWRAVCFSSTHDTTAAKLGILRAITKRIDEISLPTRTIDEEKQFIRFAYKRFPCLHA
jgi:hypothetical protein